MPTQKTQPTWSHYHYPSWRHYEIDFRECLWKQNPPNLTHLISSHLPPRVLPNASSHSRSARYNRHHCQVWWQNQRSLTITAPFSISVQLPILPILELSRSLERSRLPTSHCSSSQTRWFSTVSHLRSEVFFSTWPHIAPSPDLRRYR